MTKTISWLQFYSVLLGLAGVYVGVRVIVAVHMHVGWTVLSIFCTIVWMIWWWAIFPAYLQAEKKVIREEQATL